jgi:hypothetical protein
MPKRTNEFQDLVALIQRALAPRGAEVTESAEVAAESPEDLREIDVLIKTAVGPYEIKIAVEAKDESRKMDLVKFESIIAKYTGRSGVLVNQVVVISRKGFAKRVIERAKRENIVLLTLAEAMQQDWSSAIPKGIVFGVGPHLARFEFNPQPAQLDPMRLAQEGEFVCTCCGKTHGSPWSLGLHAMRSQELLQEVRESASRSNGWGCARITWTFPSRFVLRHPSGDFRVESITAHVHALQARGELALKAYKVIAPDCGETRRSNGRIGAGTAIGPNRARQDS